MFQHLLRDIRRQPVAPYAILAVIGIAGAASLAAARSRRDDGTLADVRQLADRTGISEGALTTFMATVLATSAFSFLRWRSDKLARQQNEAQAVESVNDIPTQLHEHTVKELRGMAADQDIEGRSSMKKDELVDALSDSDTR